MGHFLLEDSSESESTPHQQHIQGVGDDAPRAMFYLYFTQTDSPGASDTRGASDINMPSTSRHGSDPFPKSALQDSRSAPFSGGPAPT